MHNLERFVLLFKANILTESHGVKLFLDYVTWLECPPTLKKSKAVLEVLWSLVPRWGGISITDIYLQCKVSTIREQVFHLLQNLYGHQLSICCATPFMREFPSFGHIWVWEGISPHFGNNPRYSLPHGAYHWGAGSKAVWEMYNPLWFQDHFMNSGPRVYGTAIYWHNYFPSFYCLVLLTIFKRDGLEAYGAL